MTYELHQTDAFRWLCDAPAASVQALITDPPYSSGGATRTDRAASTGAKYSTSSAQSLRPDFLGDNRDQRSMLLWMNLWLSEAQRVLEVGAPIALFTDWRQLPIMTDALQVAGFVWRGVAVWDKTEATRPQMDGFKSQCEYIVWGSNGPMPRDGRVGCLPGLFRHPVKQNDKHHQTGKPLPLMRNVVRICPAGGTILDPFAGSGTTGVAALMEGRRFIGCELVEDYVETSRRRLEQAAQETRGEGSGPLFGAGGAA